MRTRSTLAAAAAATLALVGLASPAFADTVRNDAARTEVLPTSVRAGDSFTVYYWLVEEKDGVETKKTCNADGPDVALPLTLGSGVTASASSVVFAECGTNPNQGGVPVVFTVGATGPVAVGHGTPTGGSAGTVTTAPDALDFTVARAAAPPADTTAPTITSSVLPAAPDGANGWYVTAPTVSFTCADNVGVTGCTAPSTLGEGAGQTVVGTAEDAAGNTASTTAGPYDVDLVDPTLTVSGGPADGATYFFGEVPAAPTCEAQDTATGSGPAGCTVSGGGAAIGTQTYTFTATDRAGRTGTSELSYTVKPWTRSLFYSPVDSGGVVNTVKGGSSVPLKFEVSASQELTSTSIASFAVERVSCATTATEDAVEATSTGGTSLRYDTTAGQFVQNWQTPKLPGTCYKASIRLADGGAPITALFKLK